MSTHYVMFYTKEEAEEYMNKFKEHGEYMIVMRQQDDVYYVSVSHKSPR